MASATRSKRQKPNPIYDRVDSMSPKDGQNESPNESTRESTPNRRGTPSTTQRSSIAVPQFVSFANTSELLTHLSKRIIEVFNERDYDNPFLNCLSPNIIALNASGREAVIELHRKLLEDYPNYRNEIQNTTCSVDEDAGRAKVVMTMRVQGYAFETVRQNVAVLTWTRTRDRWTCAVYRILCGIEEFD